MQGGRSRVRFPMESLGFFIDLILPALGSTQRVTEMVTRNISCGKVGRYIGLPTLSPSCADCKEIFAA